MPYDTRDPKRDHTFDNYPHGKLLTVGLRATMSLGFRVLVLGYRPLPVHVSLERDDDVSKANIPVVNQSFYQYPPHLTFLLGCARASSLCVWKLQGETAETR